MNRLAVAFGLLTACASSRSATVAVKAEAKVETHATVETNVVEDRGATTTVVEDYVISDAPVEPPSDAGVPPAPLPSVPRLARRTTIRQEPVRVVATATAEGHATTVQRTEGETTIRSETHAGWGFSLWLVALPAGALALACLAWRFKWI